jgi:hypothetical protein
MFDWLRSFVETYIVAEVPHDMSACLDCGAIHCANDTFQACPYRLTRAAGLKARDRVQRELLG